MMSRFRRRAGLAVIERYRVTHGQYVPTMFVRNAAAAGGDPGPLRRVQHPAGRARGRALPVEVKRRMIDWWGPVLVEYYAGTRASA